MSNFRKNSHLLSRICCLLIAAVLCCTMLASCGEDGETSDGAVSDQSSTSSTTSETSDPSSEYTDEDGNYVAQTSGNTYNGETITFLVISVNETYNSELMYNDYENPSATTSTEEIPEVINKAYADRNAVVEEKLDVVIAEEFLHDPSRKNAKLVQRVREDNLAFTATYDFVVPCLYDGATMAQEGLLVNLYSLPGIQMEAPWWDQFFNDEMTIAGQLYFAIGDIGTVNKSSTAALTFNKTMYETYNLDDTYGGSLYDIVREGKWTIDLAIQMTKEFSDDLNGDGKIDYNDQVGWSGQLDDMWSLFYGSGSKLASTETSDGYPELTAYSERSSNVMEKIQSLVQDDKSYLSANDYFGVVQWPSVLLRDNFIAGNSLFYNGSVSTPIELGDMKDDYGMVPMPKSDEAQDNYYSLVNPWTSTCFAVPMSVSESDYEMLADVLNVMGAASINIVSPAYLEQCLEYMKTRDNDTIDMIENYILPGRGCDIGLVYAWGGVDTLLHNMASNQVGTFASSYQAIESAAQAALDETINFFKAMK